MTVVVVPLLTSTLILMLRLLQEQRERPKLAATTPKVLALTCERKHIAYRQCEHGADRDDGSTQRSGARTIRSLLVEHSHARASAATHH